MQTYFSKKKWKMQTMTSSGRQQELCVHSNREDNCGCVYSTHKRSCPLHCYEHTTQNIRLDKIRFIWHITLHCEFVNCQRTANTIPRKDSSFIQTKNTQQQDNNRYLIATLHTFCHYMRISISIPNVPTKC